MSTLLSIDPGLRGTGCALWSDSKLIFAGYIRNLLEKAQGPFACSEMAKAIVNRIGQVDAFVCEWPQTYKGKSSRGDTNDLFILAGVDAALTALLPDMTITTYVVPHEWKGNVPKPKKASESYIIEQRVRDRLSHEELLRIVWPTNKKLCLDVADAIGIGLHHLGRFERNRSYARI